MKEALERAVIRLKNGEQKYFDYIYDKTFKLVYFTVLKILNNKAQAEDVAQETFVTAFKNIQKYQSDNITAWLVTIARNLAINCYNRNKRETIVDFQENASYFGSYEIGNNEGNGIFELALKVLDETDYQIMIMSIVSGYKRREIAEVLKIPISTVSWRYKKALQILKNKLKGGDEFV